MYRALNILIITLMITFFVAGCGEKTIQTKADPISVAEQVAKFSPVTIQYDHNLLDENEAKALREIVKAAQYMDEIFLHQVYSRNEGIQKALMKSTDPVEMSYRELFDIMFGPFDRLEEDSPFINSISKPTGANYYPENMSKEEFNRWINENPEDKESFEDTFTLIRRQ